jgi:hypothetical protein
MTRLALWAGRAAQAMVLGVLLAAAILQLLATASGTTLFKYQGF